MTFTDTEFAQCQCLVDGCHGIYVPQRFVTTCDPNEWNISAEQASIPDIR